MTKRLLIAISSSLFFIFSYFFVFGLGTIKSTAILYGPDGAKSVQLPYEEQAPKMQFDIRAVIQRNQFKTNHLKIIPDDCLNDLTINNFLVALPASMTLRCDYQNGFVIDVGDYLKPGDNILTFRMINHGGPAKLRLENSRQGLGYLSLIAAFIISASSFFSLLMGRLGSPPIQRYLLAVGIAVFCGYFVKSQPLERANDVSGHIAHIEQVKKGNLLPKTRECWECHQPPVFYWAASLMSWPLEMDSAVPTKFYQWLCLMSYVTFLCVSLLLINRLLPIGRGWLIASMLLIFWPAGFLRASSIGNDVPLYMFAALLLYFLHTWLETRKDKHLILTSEFFLLAVLTKFSGFIFAIPCIAAMIFVANKKQLSLKSTKVIVPLAFALTAVVATYFIIQFKQDIAHQFSSAAISHKLAVGNSAKNFLLFDTIDYFTQAYTSPWGDAGGRQYFWNYIAKSSLFGEFELAPRDSILRILALVLSCLLIAVVAGTSIMALAMPAQKWKLILPSLGLISLSIATLICFRFHISAAPAGDFRYIHFMILPLSALIGQIHNFSELPYMRWWLFVSSISFSFISAIFYGYFSLMT